MKTVIWHNTRCGTSRKTLELLAARGIEPTIVEYLKTPPSAAEIERVAGLMGKPARHFLRAKEPLAKELGLTDPGVADKAIIAAMAKNPILIERPIVIAGSRAALGRPPDAVLEIL